MFTLIAAADNPSLNTYYRDVLVEPKFIIIHCYDPAHASFGNKHPYFVWNRMNVGAHYRVTKEGQIIQCVPMTGADNMFYMIRHAGPSNWKGMADIDHEKGWQTLNKKAIGIEVESPGFIDILNNDDVPGTYTVRQLNAVKWLVKHLQRRFKVPSHSVLAHSDISPYRIDESGKVILGKNDPSESFAWGDFIKQAPLSEHEKENRAQFLESALTQIGYDLNRDGKVTLDQKPKAIKYCLLAFCRHWAPHHVNWCKEWEGLDCHNIPLSLLENLKYYSLISK